jgi:glycosyltransferase involved in cell wall biosynthesis
MRFPDARLILAGEGPEQDKIRSWIDRHGMSYRVKLPGYLHGEAKAQVLRGANMFVFTTYYGEGCPISLLEAMPAGLPVITTPVGGIPDIFIDGENGILIDHVSPQKLQQLWKDCSMMKISSAKSKKTIGVRLGKSINLLSCHFLCAQLFPNLQR